MNDARTPRYEVEELTIQTPDIFGMTDFVQLIHQANYEFRTNYNKPYDPEKPLVYAYESNGRDIILISYTDSHVVAQVTYDAARTGYSCNADEQYPITLDLYEDKDSDEPTSTVALLDKPENHPIMNDLLAFIRGGIAEPR